MECLFHWVASFLKEVILVVSGGFKEPGTAQMVTHCDDAAEEDFSIRPFGNNHLEADTMLHLHAVNAYNSNAPILYRYIYYAYIVAHGQQLSRQALSCSF